jgi:hypothetical protein
MISAFQEYCVPSYQDDSLKQRYRPYACASRAGVKVIGEVASKESGKLVDYDFLFQKLSTEIFATDRIHMYGFDGFKHKNAEAVVNSIINEIIFDILGL